MDEVRAESLVRAALIAHAASNQRWTARADAVVELERSAHASRTVDEAIERLSRLFLAAIREQPAPFRPLRTVRVDALRALIRRGVLAPMEVWALTHPSGPVHTRDGLGDAWWGALSPEHLCARVARGESRPQAALLHGLVPPSLDDSVIRQALLGAWSSEHEAARQQTLLAKLDRARLLAVLDAQSSPLLGEEAWLSEARNGTSLFQLTRALLADDAARVSDLHAALVRARFAPVVARNPDRAFDPRDALAAQCARFGYPVLALDWAHSVLAAPLPERGPFGAPLSLSLACSDAIAKVLAPDVLAAHVARMVRTLSSRASSAGQWLSILPWCAADTASLVLERASADFATQPSAFDGCVLPRDARPAWSARVAAHIDRWIERFDRSDSAESSAVTTMLRWIDVDDPAMVHAVWPSFVRMRDAIARSSARWCLYWIDGFAHDAALRGSEDARAFWAATEGRSETPLFARDGVEGIAKHASEAAQQRWVDRVMSEAPGAVDVLRIARPSATQQRAFDQLRLDSGRESLWSLLASNTALRCTEARAVALDRWYRSGCPIVGEGIYRDGVLRLVVERARGEPSCERRTRWLWSGEELIEWLASIDVSEDQSWLAEPGVSWLVRALPESERAIAQIDRLLTDRLTALTAAEDASAELFEIEQSIGALSRRASASMLRRVLTDPAITGELAWPQSAERCELLSRALELDYSLAVELDRMADPAMGIGDGALVIAAIAERSTDSLRAAMAQIERFVPEVRASSPDWRATLIEHLCLDRRAAEDHFDELTDEERERVRRAMFDGEESDDERSLIAFAAPSELATNLASLRIHSGSSPSEASDWLAVLSRLGGTAAIDAIGDVLVEWLIEEQR